MSNKEPTLPVELTRAEFSILRRSLECMIEKRGASKLTLIELHEKLSRAESGMADLALAELAIIQEKILG